jgi:integrase
MKITAKTIGSVSLTGSGSKEKIIYDEDIPGFGLRLRAGGSRVLVFTYKHCGMTRRMTLGNAVPEAFPYVRKRAAELHAEVRLGRDPAQARDDARQKAAEQAAENFKVIADRFLLEHGITMRPRYLVETRRYLEVAAKPLHSRPISSIERRDIAGLLSAAASERGPVAANRLKSALSKMFAWSMGEGLLESNPVIGTNRRRETPRDRVLVDKDTGNVSELVAVWKALDDGIGGDIGRLLILTGCRHEEIGALRWEELDEDLTRIKLPANRTKGKRERVVPLSEPARLILSRRHQVVGWPCVFSSSGRGYKGMDPYKDEVDARLPADMPHWVWHDLRRSVDTGLSCLGVMPHIVDEILGHKSSSKAGVRATYNYATYLPEKTAALTLWAEHLMAAITGTSAKVVPLGRRERSTA